MEGKNKKSKKYTEQSMKKTNMTLNMICVLLACVFRKIDFENRYVIWI